MIVAKRKPFEEIKEMLKPYKKVLNVGCGTCVSVCLAGGEKEVAVLNAEIEMARKLDDSPIELGAQTVERQCDQEYLAELDEIMERYNVYLCVDEEGSIFFSPAEEEDLNALVFESGPSVH